LPGKRQLLRLCSHASSIVSRRRASTSRGGVVDELASLRCLWR
jgi:hypothetical protein